MSIFLLAMVVSVFIFECWSKVFALSKSYEARGKTNDAGSWYLTNKCSQDTKTPQKNVLPVVNVTNVEWKLIASTRIPLYWRKQEMREKKKAWSQNTHTLTYVFVCFALSSLSFSLSGEFSLPRKISTTDFFDYLYAGRDHQWSPNQTPRNCENVFFCASLSCGGE